MRIFYAINPPPEARNLIYSAAIRLYPNSSESKSKSLSIVNLEDIHITLKYVGGINDERHLPILISALERAITSTANAAPPLIKISGFGCFPSENHPRVIWARISQEANAHEFLSRLSSSISEFLQEKGVPLPKPEKSFIPHVTIARVKKMPEVLSEIKKFLASPPALDVAFVPDGIHLVESRLRPAGPEYKTIFFRPFRQSLI